jgi:hypothetical protein
MRVLRLDLGRVRIELHPYVTVVRGLSPEVRARLLDVLAAVPAGRAQVGGLIEAHGVFLDLDPATLALLDLDQPLDVVVRRTDLPGGSPRAAPGGDPVGPEARARLAEAEAALAAAELQAATAADRRRATADALAAEPAPGSPFADTARADPTAGDTRAAAASARSARDTASLALAAAEAEHRRAADELRVMEEAALLARERRRDAGRALSVAAAALETAGDRRDATAAAVVDAARARLAEAEATLEQVRASGQAGAAEALDTTGLQADRMAAQAALLALDTTDPLPIRAALDQLREGRVTDLVPVPEAMALADELAGVEADLLRLPATTPEQSEVQHEERALARRRVELAQEAVADLEAALHQPAFHPADVTALEAAHLEVLEAREAAGKRFGAAKAARQLEEAAQAEQEVLDRMGLVTYTEYLMSAGGSTSGVQFEESLPARLEAARQELARAEAQLASRDIDVRQELERAALVDRRRELRDKAVELLGSDPGDDVDGALRRLRVASTSTGEHLGRLRAALEGAGLVLADEDVEERFLVDLAKVWLHEQGETEAQRRTLEQQIATIDVQLAAAEARAAAPDLDEPLAIAAGAAEDARAALAAAEARLARDEATAAEIASLREAFAAASEADAAVAAELTAVEERVQEAAEAARQAATAVREARQALAVAQAAEAAALDAAAADEQRLATAQAIGRDGLEEELAHADAGVEAAERAVAAAIDVVERVRAEIDAAATAPAAPAASVPTGDGAAVDPEDIEWYLLARLAAQRSVSYAGSVPLVVDDALAGLGAENIRAVLNRLERMASTVQIVVVTEDLTAVAWAEGLGEERAQVVEVAGVAS